MSSIEELLAHIPPLAADTSNSSAPEVGTPGRNMLTHFPCWPGQPSEPKLIQALNKEGESLLLQKRSIGTGGRSTAVSPELSRFRTAGETREERMDSNAEAGGSDRAFFGQAIGLGTTKPSFASKIPIFFKRDTTFGPRGDDTPGVSCYQPQPKVLNSESELSEDWQISEISVLEEDMTEKPESVFEPRDRRVSISKNLKPKDFDQLVNLACSRSGTGMNNVPASQGTYEPFTPVNRDSYSQVQKKSEADFANLGKTPVGSFEMRINIGMKGYYL